MGVEFTGTLYFLEKNHKRNSTPGSATMYLDFHFTVIVAWLCPSGRVIYKYDNRYLLIS